MKKIYLAIILLLAMASIASSQTYTYCPVQQNCTTSGNNIHNGSETFNGPVNILGGGSFGGSFTFTGPQTFSVINNTYYVSQGVGSDLGAKANYVIGECLSTFAACSYVFDIGGTISTPPVFPLGSYVECRATGPITLATTWLMNHRNTTYNFNGCELDYNQDSGQAAILVGKNIAGTVNCNGTSTVTLVSGNEFTTFDFGDQVNINGVPYNVGAVTPTTLTVAGTCASGTGVPYASATMGVSFVGGPYLNSVTIRDLYLKYTGTGVTNDVGIGVQFVDHVYGNNIFLLNWPQAFQSFGMLVSQFDKLKILNCNNGIDLDVSTRAGVAISSNVNTFLGAQVDACLSTSGQPIVINASGQNHFIDGDFESNEAKYTVTITGVSNYNRFDNSNFESNGNGISGSADVYSTATYPNLFYGNTHSTGVANTPTTGIDCTGANVICNIDQSLFIGPYTYGWTFVSGATGSTRNNTLGVGITNTLPIVSTLPIAAQFPDYEIYVGDSTAVSAEGQTCTGGSTHVAVAKNIGGVWKCF